MKDHYVSQTYLQAFTNSNGKLIPYYKRKHVIVGKPKSPKSVCKEIDGDANKYFDNPRVLDSYLPQFENSWKHNIEKLRNRYIDSEVKYLVAGYIAYLRMCTPTAKRIGRDKIESMITPRAYSVLRKQLATNPPESQEATDAISNAIDNHLLRIDVDREYPHALGIDGLAHITHRLYNGVWPVMIIDRQNYQFVTNDCPAITYYHRHSEPAVIYVPLAPDLVVLIDALNSDESAPNHEDYFVVPKANFIHELNEQIVRSAEECVFHAAANEDLARLVKANENWRTEIATSTIQTDEGTLIFTRETQAQNSQEKPK